MNSSFFHYLLRLAMLMILQVLICNNIHLLGYATPLLIGYMIIAMQKGTDRVYLLLWGFVTGLIYDIFSNTAGMAASGMTLLAMLQPSILTLLSPRDSEENMTPCIRTMGLWTYTSYVFMCMLLIHAVFFLLDAFMLADIKLTIISIFASSILATILSLLVEMLTTSSKD